jgi:hypothetical protein
MHWGNNMSTIDYQTRIETDRKSVVFTNEYDGGIELSIMRPQLRLGVILNRDQALALIDAITHALSAGEVTA